MTTKDRRSSVPIAKFKRRNDAMVAMTPLGKKAMTPGQIGKAVAKYRVLLEKYAAQFSSSDVQLALGNPRLEVEQFFAFRRAVEFVSSEFIRRVFVSRDGLSPRAALASTGFDTHFYKSDEFIDATPRGVSGWKDVHFFKVGLRKHGSENCLTNEDVVMEYKMRGLNPADLYTLVAVTNSDRELAKTHQYASYLLGADGVWYSVDFFYWTNEGRVHIVNKEHGARDREIWLVGLRKKS